MRLKEGAAAYAIVKAARDALDEALKGGKGELVALMVETEASQTKATLPDGTVVATVSLVEGKETIAPGPGLLAWAKEHEPKAVVPAKRRLVEVAEHLEPTALVNLVARMKYDEANACFVDTETGERMPQFTLVRSMSESYPQVRYAEGGSDACLARLGVKAVTENGLKALAEGLDDEA